MVDRDQEDFDYDSNSEKCISDNDKENCVGNTSSKRKRLSRSTTEQMKKIKLYMQSHDDFSKGKTSESQEFDWNKFTDELNLYGPPHHTPKEWRKVWSDWKGNQKRKRLAVGNIEPPNPEVERTNDTLSETNDMQNNAETITRELLDEILPAIEESSSRDGEDENTQIQILNTLKVVVEQQRETNNELSKLNNNFRDFMDLFKPK